MEPDWLKSVRVVASWRWGLLGAGPVGTGAFWLADQPAHLKALDPEFL